MGLRAKVKQMGLPLEQRLLMEGNITRLINDMGACENIFATPIPVGYTKHTTRFLFIWLFFLPFALQGQLGVGTVSPSRYYPSACWESRTSAFRSRSHSPCCH